MEDLRAELAAGEAGGPSTASGGDPTDPRLEREVRQAARRLMELRPGWRVWDLEQERAGTSTRQDPGPADWFVCGHGITVWIEWKRPNGKTRQSKAQREFEQWVVKNGGIYLLMRTEAELVDWLREIERAAGGPNLE